MAKYINRTCHQCGIRKPQPEMHKKTIYVETGRSRTGLSERTVAGMLLGDPKSSRSFNSWAWNSGQRTYQRKKEVWVCGQCGGTDGKGLAHAIGEIIGFAIVFLFLAFVAVYIGVI